jgi:hypothetical protein
MCPMNRIKARLGLVGAVLISIAAATACGGETPSPTPKLSWTPWPTATAQQLAPTRLPSAAPTQRGSCSDSARFVEDLTIPDGSVVTPGTQLDKRWAVQNNGTCDWGPGYRLVWVGGEVMPGPDSVDLYPARAGERATLRVVMQAPAEPGDYISRWRAQSPEGIQFGDEIYMLIVVEAPTPTPTSTPLVTPVPTSE